MAKKHQLYRLPSGTVAYLELNPIGKIIKDKGLDPGGDAQKFHTANVLKRIKRYMPFNSGMTYKVTVAQTDADGTEILDYENYPTFPIVPLWGNQAHMSEIVGCRAGIDAYDLIKSGFANDLDNAQMYWILHNAGGMDDTDLAQFLDRLKTVHAAVVDDDAGTGVDAHTVEIPTTAREAMLDRLRSDLYEDYMALDTKSIAGGAVTATQIQAAYEPFDAKLTALEYCVIEFIQGLLELAGVEDTPTFTRSRIINSTEEIQSVVQAAPYLGEEYATKKILTLLGDGDQAEDILRKIDADELDRFPEETGAE